MYSILLARLAKKFHLLPTDGKNLCVHYDDLLQQEDESFLLCNVLLPQLGELKVKMLVDSVDPVHQVIYHLEGQRRKFPV
jgi:hypothetical protein